LLFEVARADGSGIGIVILLHRHHELCPPRLKVESLYVGELHGLENVGCSRCWAGFGSTLGRPMDVAEIPAAVRQNIFRFVKCVPKSPRSYDARRVAVLDRSALAGARSRISVGCEAPSWDSEHPTRSCPPLSKNMLSLLALSAGAPTLAPKVTVLACTEAF
jgi:hypothetical protein